jgi:hypothetical protein
MADPLAHDARCDRQDEKLTTLQTKFDNAMEDVDSLVNRLQRLIDEYHDQNVIIGRFDERLKRVESDAHSIVDTLREKVTPKEDYLTLRNQVWGAVGAVFLLFIASLFYLVTHPSTASAAQGLVSGVGK